jgi:hypothetical protein
MGKYDPLLRHLQTARSASVAMTFAEIEAVLGFALPPSSQRHRAWWSNNASNSAITRAWLEAGFQTEQVDLGRGRLVFRRTSAGAAGAKSGRHPLFGSMKGTVTFAPGVDLSQPADPEWAELAYGEDR